MKNVDFLRFNPVLTVNSTKGYVSNAGGFFSIILALLTVLSLIAFSKDLVFKTNPNSSYTEDTNPNAFISNDKLFLTMAPLLTGGISIQNVEQYLDIEFGVIDMDGRRNTSATAYYNYYKAIPCLSSNDQKFKANYDSIKSFFAVNETNYFCGPPEHRQIDLLSTYGSSKFIAWDIKVKFCKNTTESASCKSKEDIKKLLNLFFVQIVISTNLIDTSNLEAPFIQTYTSKILRVSATTTRQDINFLKTMTLKSDEGFLMESLILTESYFLSRADNDSIYDDNPEAILRLLITNDQNSMNIKREYVKIQKVAADVGGILKFFLIIVSGCNLLISKVDFLTHFYNRLYCIESSILVPKHTETSRPCAITEHFHENYRSTTTKHHATTLRLSTDSRYKNKKIDLSRHIHKGYHSEIGLGFTVLTKLVWNYYCNCRKNLLIKRINRIYSQMYSIESVTDSQFYIKILAEKSGISLAELHNLCVSYILKELDK